MSDVTFASDIYGYGAWAYGFLKVTNPWMGGKSDRLGLAILALKREFIYNGFLEKNEPKWTYNNLYGDQFANLVALYQRGVGLLPPTYTQGTLGPTVAAYIFRLRTRKLEQKYGIPSQWLGHVRSLESNNDPCALGWIDHADRGLLQISGVYHPEVTDEQAFDPAFALEWGAKNLRAAFDSFQDWEAAIASHNVGTYGASQWLAAGKPATGGIDSFPGLFDRATLYVKLVKNSQV